MNKIQLEVEAGEKAVKYGEEFHCSESALRALNDVFNLKSMGHDNCRFPYLEVQMPATHNSCPCLIFSQKSEFLSSINLIAGRVWLCL